MNATDTTWVLVSAALVLFMTPGLALFYGGMVRAKNVLAVMMNNYVAIGVVSLLWAVVGFTLAFATDPAAPELGFFVCQQHYPENFWNRVFQQHPNAAVDISGVTLAALQPERHRTFLSRFSGTSPRPLPGGGLLWDLSRGSIEVLPTAAPNPSEWPAMLTTLSVQVPEPGRARSILAAKGFPCTNMAQGVIVPAEALHGVSLRFTHIQHPGADGSEPD